VAGREAAQSPADQLDRVLTPQQVAEWLKVKPRQLGVLGVPYLDWGHKTKRYSAKDVQAWLDEQPRVRRQPASHDDRG
jgi:hypothetical protein